MLPIAVLILLAGLVLWLWARRQQRSAGLPVGRIIYTDTSKWQPADRVLYDAEIKLAGKPDYLVRQGSQVIPVEVKSSRVNETPYESHGLQLAAYCRLVESTYQKRPDYGILHYLNRTFSIDFTPKLESELLKLIQEIRLQKTAQAVDRSHDSPGRCRACGYRSVCDQNLESTTTR